MLLFRKKPPATSRRRLQTEDTPRSFAYNSNASKRTETSANTGRGTTKKKSSARSLRHFWLQRFGLIILCTVLVISLISVLSLSPNARILPLESGSATNISSLPRSPAVYQAAASKFLAGSIWNRNKITVDTSKFNRQMMKQFPELASVSVTLPLLAHRPVVYLQPSQPALVLITSSGSFVIDTRGKALLAADQSSAESKLPQVLDQSGLRAELNHQVLSSDNVSFVQAVVAQLAAKQVTASSMVLPAGTSELDVHLAGKPYFVKFNLHNNDPRQQVGTFLATVASLQKKNTAPAQYVDVRVDGRAYYQ